MISLKLAKAMFFDTKRVTSAVDAATRRVLSKFGSFVRTTARHSIRKRKRPAPPGSPPSSHTGLLRRFIFFGYDTSRRSVVIGPVRLGNKIGDAPPALEYGGPSRIVTGKQSRTVTIAPRPFMGPALQAEKPKLPGMWSNSIK